MKLTLAAGKLLNQKTDALIVGIYRGKLTKSAEAVDKASKNALSALIKEGDATGCLGTVGIFPNFPGIAAKRLVVVGLGKEEDGVLNFQKALSSALKAVYFVKTAVISCTDWFDLSPEWVAEQVSCTAIDVLEKSVDYKSNPDRPAWKQPKSVSLFVEEKTPEITTAFAEGAVIGKGIKLAKELGDAPANLCTPKYMAEQCVNLGSSLKFDVTVFEEKALNKLKMGCFLGVAAGSKQPAYMIVMEYNGGQKKEAPVALVGKGLTFDAGGISLKPAKGMDEMKYDMSGAASIVAAMATAASLKLPINIVGVIGCTENLPSGSAVKPGDILCSYSGKTVEVLNTDAEGRLVLCDLLSYTIDKFKPILVVDAATLTGACVVALGHEYTGLFSNNEELALELLQAGENSLDKCWRLPLGRAYTKALKSRFADLANIGAPGAGACTAAAFLQEFVGKTPWAHLDIAGTAGSSGEEKGSTGRPVPLLISFLKDLTH